MGRFVILAALMVGAATRANVQVPDDVIVHVPDVLISFAVPAIDTLVTVPVPAAY
jgi:hypothetical protein